MLKIVIVLNLIVSAVLAGVFPNYRYEHEFVALDDNEDWWKTGNFYQIYPRSFQDSNGDGVGDLKGITERLPYLKEIGVTATWLSPIFTSPMADFGYDIANFTEVDPIFGTMEDFDAMIKRAKELNIKIILDFVPNHSSDECTWFQKSIEKDPIYKDFYVWHPGRPNAKDPSKPLPPSNWVSVFRGSAWTWNDQRKEYYLHQFVAKQPDLNYRNPIVHQHMQEVLRFWLKKGISGYRIDAVPHVYECPQDENNNFIDEPHNDGATDPNDYGYLKHTCTVDQPETLELVYEWRKVMDDFQKEHNTETKVLLAETYSPIDIVMKYYGNGEVKGAHIPFNFLMISWLNNQSNAEDYANAINEWQSKMIGDRTPNWVVGNHDKNRVGSRLGADRMDMMNMIVMTLPGIAVTYQGEEIGMTDVWISWKDTVDPSACNSNQNIYEKLSRDPERTPFQWDASINSGFSIAEKTWLPVSPKYKIVNVERERGIALSRLNVYKNLRTLRNEQVFKNPSSKTVVKALNKKNVLAIVRSLDEEEFITLANINDDIELVNMESLGISKKQFTYTVVTDRSMHSIGDVVQSDKILLAPKEGVVLRSKPNKYFKYKLD